MNRPQLKCRGKAAFKQNYWKSVLVALLLTLAIGGLGASGANSIDVQESNDNTNYGYGSDYYGSDYFGSDYDDSYYYNFGDSDDDISSLLPNNGNGPVASSGETNSVGLTSAPAGSTALGSETLSSAEADSTVLGAGATGATAEIATVNNLSNARRTVSLNIGNVAGLGSLGVLLTIFLFGPLEVSCRNFFKKNLSGPAALDTLNVGFVPKYWHNLGTMLLRSVFEVLWTLLFIIPGFVMYYAYAMTPYLLNDYPDLGVKETIDLSRNMMKGHKADLFVLDLSFIGWILLSVVTFGIVGIFYTNPYMASTHAAFYEDLKAQSLDLLPRRTEG